MTDRTNRQMDTITLHMQFSRPPFSLSLSLPRFPSVSVPLSVSLSFSLDSLPPLSSLNLVFFLYHSLCMCARVNVWAGCVYV